MPMIPGTINAGNSLDWKESLSDYPASAGWTMHYAIFNASDAYALASVADGDSHYFAVDAATTERWIAGRYDYSAYVKNVDGRRKSIRALPLLVKADPTKGPHDGRTHARKMLDAIEAILEDRATNDELDIVKAAFGERALEQDGAGLRIQHDRYLGFVVEEEQKAKLAAGIRPQNKIKMRFTRRGG